MHPQARKEPLSFVVCVCRLATPYMSVNILSSMAVAAGASYIVLKVYCALFSTLSVSFSPSRNVSRQCRNPEGDSKKWSLLLFSILR